MKALLLLLCLSPFTVRAADACLPTMAEAVERAVAKCPSGIFYCVPIVRIAALEIIKNGLQDPDAIIRATVERSQISTPRYAYAQSVSYLLTELELAKPTSSK